MDDGTMRREEPSSDLDRFAAAMAAVLDRCVWSREMTHEKLVPYLIEESHELIDAIETGDRDGMLEELGDVLWQVVFHAEIAARSAEEPFDIQEVAARAGEKMRRRHPHVFGDAVAETPEEVERLWNRAKAEEKGARRSVLDGIPSGMPALALAHKVIGRGERVGLLPAATGGPTAADEAELGAQLLSLVARARARGLDAERALRTSVRRLEDEIREREATAPGVPSD